MMQMLAAGGLPLLTDGARVADANNPRGYCEWAPIKSLSRTPEVIEAAEGKAIKVISSLLPALSSQYEYKVIFMCRPLEEIVASQDKMLERLGKEVPSVSKESVVGAFQRHLDHVRAWLAKQPNMGVLYIPYSSLLETPKEVAHSVCRFLENLLDTEAMARQVDTLLYRERVVTNSRAS